MFATKSHRRRFFCIAAITALMVFVSVALNLGTGLAAGQEQEADQTWLKVDLHQ
jgi:hypothetical protein